MHFKPNDLEPNELAFRFESNDLISPAALGTFLREIERLARHESQFGAGATVRLLDIGTGSLWGRIRITGKLEKAAYLATIGAFLLMLEDRINEPDTNIAQCVAEMALDSSVVSATITTHEREISIKTRDLSAVERLERSRAATKDVHSLKADNIVAGSIRVSEQPSAGTAPTGFGEGAFGEGSYGGVAPINKAMHELSDKRGSVNVLGRFSVPEGRSRPVTFTAQNEVSYHVELEDDLSADDVPHDKPVMIRANLNQEDGKVVVWEIWELTDL